MAKEETKIDMGIEMTKLWYKDGYGHTASVIKYRDPFGGNPLSQKSIGENNETAPIYVALEGRQPELLINALNELERYRAKDSVEVDKRLEAADILLEKMHYIYDTALEIKPLTKKKSRWQL